MRHAIKDVIATSLILVVLVAYVFSVTVECVRSIEGAILATFIAANVLLAVAGLTIHMRAVHRPVGRPSSVAGGYR